MLPGIIILIVVGVIGVVLLLWTSRDIKQLNTNSTPTPMSSRKKFHITIRSIAGLWFVIVALVGLCRLLTGI